MEERERESDGGARERERWRSERERAMGERERESDGGARERARCSSVACHRGLTAGPVAGAFIAGPVGAAAGGVLANTFLKKEAQGEARGASLPRLPLALRARAAESHATHPPAPLARARRLRCASPSVTSSWRRRPSKRRRRRRRRRR